MKTIMYTRNPKECANILNGDQSLIVSKTCPKDWKDYLSGKTKTKPEPREVYIYCTHGKALCDLRKEDVDGDFKLFPKINTHRILACNLRFVNCMVFAKFTLNKVEEIFQFPCKHTDTLSLFSLAKNSCLSLVELENYLSNKNGYVWHIDNLEIFDEPKELSEFKVQRGYSEKFNIFTYKTSKFPNYETLKRPFPSWGYVEVEQ